MAVVRGGRSSRGSSDAFPTWPPTGGQTVQDGGHDGLTHPPLPQHTAAPGRGGDAEGAAVLAAGPIGPGRPPGQHERVLHPGDLRGDVVAAGGHVNLRLSVSAEAVRVQQVGARGELAPTVDVVPSGSDHGTGSAGASTSGIRRETGAVTRSGRVLWSLPSKGWARSFDVEVLPTRPRCDPVEPLDGGGRPERTSTCLTASRPPRPASRR